MDTNEPIVSPDEAKAEQEALVEAKADEVRAKIVTDLGLADDDDNKPVIDKLVERELSHKKKLSEAIGQKIKWRDQVKVAKPAQPVKKDEQSFSADDIRKQAETAVEARLEQRDLDEMDYSDEIKAEIKKVAQIQGVSVRQAVKDPYIQARIDKVKAADRVTEAGTARSSKAIPLNAKGMPKFDFSTEKGRKDYDEWKAARKSSE